MGNFMKYLNLFEELKNEYTVKNIMEYEDRSWRLNIHNDGLIVDTQLKTEYGTVYETYFVTIAPFDAEVEALSFECSQISVVTDINEVKQFIHNIINEYTKK